MRPDLINTKGDVLIDRVVQAAVHSSGDSSNRAKLKDLATTRTALVRYVRDLERLTGNFKDMRTLTGPRKKAS